MLWQAIILLSALITNFSKRIKKEHIQVYKDQYQIGLAWVRDKSHIACDGFTKHL